ncbi:MAG: carboxypeptidase regulatory-like domain-containing protein [Gemmatimonadota bacterium]|nr:carboxypeptidase regulatory-like domain-containing protein [Gemmatimonadota bacterium]
MHRYVAGLLLAALASAAAAQRGTGGTTWRLTGVVTDTGRHPLAGVQVTVVGTALVTTTDSTGRFTFPAFPAGAQRLAFRSIGFAPDSARVDPRGIGGLARAALRPLAVRLAPTVVTAAPEVESAKLAGFYRRRAAGRGQFITRAEFEPFAPPDVASVLRRFHSLRVEPSPDGALVMSTRGMTMKNMRLTACAMRVGVDGQLMPADFGIDEISVGEVEAIEVYAGPASMPAQFQTVLPGQEALAPDTALHGGGTSAVETSTSCGLVMVWTRSGGR